MADLLAPRSPRRGRYPGLAPGRRDHNFVISPQLSAGSRRGAAAAVATGRGNLHPEICRAQAVVCIATISSVTIHN